METYGFFDATLVDGAYDRVYLSSDFAKYFASFVGNGIFGGSGQELLVSPLLNPGMGIEVSSGQAWIDGRWYENTEALNLGISIADGLLNRIDLIVLRCDYQKRTMSLQVIEGTPATDAVAPPLTRNLDMYDLCLAKIFVNAGIGQIDNLLIEDTRMNSDVCGMVKGVIDQIDVTGFGNQLQGFINEYITKCNQRFDEFVSHITTLETNATNDYNAYKTAIDGLLADAQSYLVTYKENVDGLLAEAQSYLSTYKTNVDGLLSDGSAYLSTYKTTIDGFASEGNDYLTIYKGDIDSLKSQANSLYSELVAHVDKITGNVTTDYDVFVQWVATTKANAEADIAELLRQLSDLIDEQQIGELIQLCYSLRDEVVAARGTFASLDERFNSFDARVTGIESDVSSINDRTNNIDNTRDADKNVKTAKELFRTDLGGTSQDLNLLTSTGFYKCITTGNSSSILNRPTGDGAFILDVEKIRDNGADDFITLQLFSFSGDGYIYSRLITRNGETITIGEWVKLATQTDINSVAAAVSTAQSTADSALSTANTAKSTADSAVTSASNAQASADSANSAASSAANAASAAQSTANSAASAASAAQTTANNALPKSGGTMSGNINLNGVNIRNETLTTGNAQVIASNTVTNFVGNTSTHLSLESKDDVTLNRGSSTYKLYHEGNKPRVVDMQYRGKLIQMYQNSTVINTAGGEYYCKLFDAAFLNSNVGGSGQGNIMVAVSNGDWSAHGKDLDGTAHRTGGDWYVSTSSSTGFGGGALRVNLIVFRWE